MNVLILEGVLKFPLVPLIFINLTKWVQYM
jgi:hypothetical protein